MDQSILFSQAFAELCEIKFGKTHPVCNLVSLFFGVQRYVLSTQLREAAQFDVLTFVCLLCLWYTGYFSSSVVPQTSESRLWQRGPETLLFGSLL